MTERRVPRPRDFADLLKFRTPTLDVTARRLANAHTIADLRAIAKRVTPKAPFDYTDGAAEAELSLARARQAFLDIEFHPAILRDVSTVDTSCTVTGGPSPRPSTHPHCLPREDEAPSVVRFARIHRRRNAGHGPTIRPSTSGTRGGRPREHGRPSEAVGHDGAADDVGVAIEAAFPVAVAEIRLVSGRLRLSWCAEG